VLALGSMVMGLALIAGCIKDQLNALHDDFARDMLSGLLSRHAFEARAKETIEAAQSENVPLSLIIGDIDHFKQVNDIWGHQVGDNAIEAFGALVLGTVRDTDVCGRVGGEEFCILVWNADSRVAASLADRLRIGMTAIDINGMSDNTHLTASFGAAGLNADDTYRKLFARADKALYRAKNAGRNAVEADHGEPVTFTRRVDDVAPSQAVDENTHRAA
jgi:diguanylate cyclase (GGDEF)-like protein